MTALISTADANVALGAIGAVIAIALFVWFETPFQVALASFIDRWRQVGEDLDDIAAGWIPEEPPADINELEDTRPIHLDECGRCEGRGQIVTIEDGLPGYRHCVWCRGSGVRSVA